MKLPCIKVTVKLGYEAYFIALCKSLRVDCRQYPTEALKNRFSVKARKKDFIGCDCVLIVEDMPVVTANWELIMNNIPERYKVTAIPIDSTEREEGYLFYIKDDECLIPCLEVMPLSEGDFNAADSQRYRRIDIKTIRPVALPPVRRDIFNPDPFIPGKRVFLGNYAYCPNCDKFLEDLAKPNFCPQCGMALDNS